tara:strand:- start:268 stop:996 length:729 start_codon:yes stop_codon:yes gene_type:complete
MGDSMKKSKLEGFIKRYNLGGNVNSVKWKSNGDSLSTSFVTPDKSLLGNTSLDNFKFDDSEIGVYRTDSLQKLLGALSDEVDLELLSTQDTAVSLKLNDKVNSVDFTLSRLDVIPNTPDMKKIPDFQTKIKLNSQFIDSFIRGKSALSESDSFTILNKDGSLQVVIGYSSTNTDRVNIPVETETNGLDDKITFNANLFKEVLVANKECTSAVLEVSNEGLARVNFKVDDYDSTYYVVATSEV